MRLADGGSLLLDEIGDMPADLQAKLLRVVQEGCGDTGWLWQEKRYRSMSSLFPPHISRLSP